MSYREIYLTGRKHCSRCRRWRPLIDFGVLRWVDIERTIPASLKPQCTICLAQVNRERKGYKRRQTYGQPGSPAWRAHKRELQREYTRKRWREEPKFAEQRNEYMRIYREAKGITKTTRGRKARERSLIRVNVNPFIRWFDNRESIVATEGELRQIRKARHEGSILLTVVDSVMTKSGDGYFMTLLYPLDDDGALEAA